MGDNAEAGDIEQEGKRDVKPVEDLQEENDGDRYGMDRKRITGG